MTYYYMETSGFRMCLLADLMRSSPNLQSRVTIRKATLSLVTNLGKNILRIIWRSVYYPNLRGFHNKNTFGIIDEPLESAQMINKQVPLIMIILFYFMLKTSSALPVNPKLMTPTHLMHSHIMQLQLQPYQILSKYLLFGDQLMQPRLPQTQISPIYPILGNLLAFPLGAPNTQMLPIMLPQLGQQGLLSGSDSEEGILSGVLIVPVDQGNMINVHHSGVRLFGQDSAVFMGQQDPNPVGQKGINESYPSNHFPAGNDVPVVIPQERGRDDSPGASIINPSDGGHFSTQIPPVGIRITPANPTIKPEIESTNIVEHDVTSDTENWVFCDSYMPDSHLQDMTRGDGYIPPQAPKYYFIENAQDNQTEK